MDRSTNAYVWMMRAVYAALSCVFLMFHLLPLGQSSNLAFAPDLILGLTLVWVSRRPEFAPVLLIAATALLADLLLARAPGLWAALTLLLSEYIRNRGQRMKSAGFIWEWVRVSAGIAVIFLVNRIVLSVLFVNVPPLAAVLTQFGATVLLYPVITALSAVLLRVRYIEAAETGGRVRA